MHSLVIEFIAEFVGTFILMSFGLSGSATNILGNFSSVLFPASGFAAGLTIGAFFAGPITGGHMNPAVSLAFALIGKCPWRSLPVYIVAQYLGSLAASGAIYGIYSESIRALDSNLTSATAGIFITVPAEHITLFPAICDQLLSTGILVFAALMMGNQACIQFPVPSQILTCSALIFALIFSFSFNANAILNPARDLSPRILLSLVGYRSLPFDALSGHFWWAVGILGPHLGAIIGALAYEFLRRIREEHFRRHNQTEITTKIRRISKEFDSNNNAIFH